jgi:hypothetical protein
MFITRGCDQLPSFVFSSFIGGTQINTLVGSTGNPKFQSVENLHIM